MMVKTTLNTEGLSPSATFRGGKGFSEHYVDCSANPYDLRPAANIIVGAAHKMLSNLPEDTPLVILMGENHAKPSHSELKHIVTSQLLDHKNNLTVNFEWPHNHWAIKAQQAMRVPIPSTLFYDISTYDKDGRGALSAFMAFCLPATAPVALHNLIAFCYHNGITSTFNDAADIDRVLLDLKDPFTAAIVDKYAEKYRITDKNINTFVPDGIAIRNIIMAQRGTAHAKENGTRIILQYTGRDHIFGDTQEGLPSENSLCATYRAAGAEVLPVFITSREDNCGLNIIPESAYTELPNSVIIDGLAEEYFYMSSLSRLWNGEKRFIKKLHKNSGGGLELYDVAANKKKYKKLAYTHAEEILARAAAHNKDPKPPLNTL